MERNGSEELDDGHPQYLRTRRLARGNFGNVYLAEHRRGGKVVALKYIEVTQDVLPSLRREVYNHFNLFHPHIVALRHVSFYNNHLVLEMEPLLGGDMFTFIKKTESFRNGMPENIARWYFQQIVMAVHYCHAKHVCNRDIKLENVLLKEQPNENHPLVKLCDFGSSKDESKDSAPHTRQGTPNYVAPEILLSAGTLKYHGDTADSWSLGVVLYFLVTGRFPFYRLKDAAQKKQGQLNVMTQRILAADYEFPHPDQQGNASPGPQLSSSVRDLIRQLLTLDPKERMVVGRIMQHQWFFDGTPPENREKIEGLTNKQLEIEESQHQQYIAERLAEADAVFQQVEEALAELNNLERMMD